MQATACNSQTGVNYRFVSVHEPGPITLFYPPGLYLDLLVGRWTRYFGVIYGPRHAAARCSKVAASSGSRTDQLSKKVRRFIWPRSRSIDADSRDRGKRAFHSRGSRAAENATREHSLGRASSTARGSYSSFMIR